MKKSDNLRFTHRGKRFIMEESVSGDHYRLLTDDSDKRIVYDDSANSDFYGDPEDVKDIFISYLDSALDEFGTYKAFFADLDRYRSRNSTPVRKSFPNGARRLYVVKVGTAINDYRLNTVDKTQYETIDRNLAYKVYNDEVEYLKKYKKRVDDLDYTPSDREVDAATFVELLQFDNLFDEDDDRHIESLKQSDFFFDV